MANEEEKSEYEKASEWLNEQMKSEGVTDTDGTFKPAAESNSGISEEDDKPPTEVAQKKKAKAAQKAASEGAPAPEPEEDREETPQVDARTARLIGWLLQTGTLDVLEAAASVAFLESEHVALSLLPIPRGLRSVLANMASIGHAIAEFETRENGADQ